MLSVSSRVVIIWLALGFSMVVLNKTILTVWDFPFPFFVVTVCCFVGTILIQILANTTKLLPAVNESKITLNVFMTKLVPVSLLFSYGLAATNLAYMYLSLSNIQMLKSMKPVGVLSLSFLCGREEPSLLLSAIIAVICSGVVISSLGELQFSAIGTAIQLSEVFSDCARLLALDVLLKDLKLDTLSLMYFLAPVNTVLTGIGFLLFESSKFRWAALTPTFVLILLADGVLAFAMNVSSKFVSALCLIRETSAVVLTICGPLRDIALIITSVLLFGAPITTVQILGYVLSILGLVLYRVYSLLPVNGGEEIGNDSGGVGDWKTFCCYGGDYWWGVVSSLPHSLSGYDSKFEYTPVPGNDDDDNDDSDGNIITVTQRNTTVSSPIVVAAAAGSPTRMAEYYNYRCDQNNSTHDNLL